MRELLLPKQNFTLLDVCVLGAFFVASLTLKIIYWSLYGINVGSTLRNSSDAMFAIVTAPLLETILFNALLTALFLKLKIKPMYVVFLVSFLFSVAHIFNDLLYPIFIFIPCFFMSWCYVHYLRKHGFLIAFVLTLVLHSIYNLTASIC